MIPLSPLQGAPKLSILTSDEAMKRPGKTLAKVSFYEKVRRRRIIHYTNYTYAEKHACWYNSDEIAKFTEKEATSDECD